MLDRLRGVFSLSAETFNEIEHDPSAIWQALIVVVVTSLLVGLSGAYGHVLFGIGIGTDVNTSYRFAAIVGWAIIAWILWSVLTYIIGTKVFTGEATIGEMMRVIGFAYAPLAIQIFQFIPIVGLMFVFGATVWAIAAGYVAIKEGLDLGTRDAFITVAVGGLLYLIGMGILLQIL
jgi:hypothetical protein